MSAPKSIWRVVCGDGSVCSVIVEPYDDEVPPRFWKAYRLGWSGYMVGLSERSAATKVAGHQPDSVDALEILAPGEVSRAELLAEVEQLRRVAAAVRVEHRARLAWLRSLPTGACTSPPPTELLDAETATALALRALDGGAS